MSFEIFIDSSNQKLKESLETNVWLQNFRIKDRQLGKGVIQVSDKARILRLTPKLFSESLPVILNKIEQFILQYPQGNILIESPSLIFKTSRQKFLELQIFLALNWGKGIIPSNNVNSTAYLLLLIEYNKSDFQSNSRLSLKTDNSLQRQLHLLNGLLFCSDYFAQKLLTIFQTPFNAFKYIISGEYLKNNPTPFSQEFLCLNRELLKKNLINIPDSQNYDYPLRGNQNSPKFLSNYYSPYERQSNLTEFISNKNIKPLKAKILVSKKNSDKKIHNFHKADVEYKKMEIHFADYLVGEDVAVRVYRWEEFKKRRNIRKIFNKLIRFKQAYSVSLLIIYNFDLDLNSTEFNGINVNPELKLAFDALYFLYFHLKIPLIITSSDGMTIFTLTKLAKHFCSSGMVPKEPTISVNFDKDLIKLKHQLYYLFGFRYIGEKRAQKLLERFNTPWNVIMAFQDSSVIKIDNEIQKVQSEIKKLKGFGKKIIAENKKILCEKILEL